MSKKTLMAWSSGKDSAWALHFLQQDTSIEIVGLFCLVNKLFNRVSIHGVRSDLIRQQAKSLHLPLFIIDIPDACTYEEYLAIMQDFARQAKNKGIECFAFGDLFLENVREHREFLLLETGITPLFPIWGIPTATLSKQIIESGLKAIITCVDANQLPQQFAGREYNESFLKDLFLPLDPCGENGEFHSFAFDGPMFQHPIEFAIGETLRIGSFHFTDLLPIEI